MVETGFVVVSGLPGSGKTTLARALSPGLGLPVIDKDDYLDALFGARGTGDAAWRRELSRESDVLFRQAVLASAGAIATSFWHLPGMAADSGTPTDWLRDLPGPLVQVRCVCAPELAARRFLQRSRHPGHLDSAKDAVALAGELAALSQLPAFDIGTRIDVDTREAADVAWLIGEIRRAR